MWIVHLKYMYNDNQSKWKYFIDIKYNIHHYVLHEGIASKFEKEHIHKDIVASSLLRTEF